MCHNTETVDRYYALVKDRSQARELRATFDAVTASSSLPSSSLPSSSHATSKRGHRALLQRIRKSTDTSDTASSGDSAAGQEEPTVKQQQPKSQVEDQLLVRKYAVFK